MSLVIDPAVTLMDAATALRPTIEESIEVIDAERRVPKHIIDAIDAAGIFAMLLPREFGGSQVDLEVATQVVAELSRADASVGWQVIVGAGNQYFLGKLPEATMREAMAVGGNVFFRGAVAPKGIAQTVEGGYLLSGQWPLASGSFETDWVAAGFVPMGPDGPRKLPDGRPDLRIAVLHPEDVTWHDTWDSIGLRGSQSQDFSVTDVFVAEEWTASFFAGSSIDAPWYKLPPAPTAPLFSGVVVGALQGLVDDIMALGPTKKPAFGGGKTLADDPIFTTRFGELVAEVDILAAANRRVARGFMDLAESDDPFDPVAYQRLMAMSVRVQHSSTDVANSLLDLTGTTAVYSSNGMQRRWKDIRCAAMHVSAATTHYTTLGTSLCRPAAPAAA